MGSEIKKSTKSIPSSREFGDDIYAQKVTKTGDYIILGNEYGEIISLGALTTAIATFTLPAGAPVLEGFIIRILNDSYYNLTITPDSSAEHVWNSGKGYGIELPDKGTLITLRYDHTNTKWDIISKTGGKVLMEGLVLHEPMGNIYTRRTSDITQGYVLDKTSIQYGLINSDGITQSKTPNSAFAPGSFSFDGIDGCIIYEDSPNWDIFGTNTGHKTLACWVYLNALGSTEYFITHRQDGTNAWQFWKSSGNSIAFYLAAGTSSIDMSGGSFSATTWHHIAFIINGSESGLYLDGIQVNYDDDFTISNLTGNLYIGQDGDSNGFCNGRMQDLHISYNNPYNAAPNVSLDGHFPMLNGDRKPKAPFQGVMS